MIEEKIFVAGFGGQGVVVAGNVLAHAALEEGRHILGMVSYGVEVRGGASHSFVIISDQEIDCPIIDEATLGFALSQAAYEKFKTKTRADGIFFIDSSQVTEIDRKGSTGQLIEIPATQIALEIGNEKVTNMIMLGAAIQKNRDRQDGQRRQGSRESLQGTPQRPDLRERKGPLRRRRPHAPQALIPAALVFSVFCYPPSF